MSTKTVLSADLPITRDLTFAYVLSLVIAFLMAVAAVAGLLFQTDVYQTDEVLLFGVPTDVVSLVVGLPTLLGAMWLARRGKLVGLLGWPGALLYVLYIYIVYTIGVPFGALFLLHLVLVTLSAYTTIGLVVSIDDEAVRQRLAGAVPARTGGGILAILAALFIGMQIVDVVAVIAGQKPVNAMYLPPFIADFIVLAPTWLVGGIMLWRRQALGYVAGAGLLLLGGILFAGLGFVVAFPTLYAGSPINVAGVVTMLVMAMICFVPFALFLRGAASDRSP